MKNSYEWIIFQEMYDSCNYDSIKHILLTIFIHFYFDFNEETPEKFDYNDFFRVF